ncbi:PRTRC system protein B [Capnocytophaga canimorsus]|uniref:PRTRC system protein B n=1 Tax=Capnocytophaga canimorsus TaxID=28188 RepID=UPI0037CFD27C
MNTNPQPLKDLTENFGELYYPISAVVFYQTTQKYNTKCYTEFVHLDTDGTPLSAQPLCKEQAENLAKILASVDDKNNGFLQSNGLLPANVLYVNSAENGYVIWYTKAQRRKLLFAPSLQMEKVCVSIPPLVWKAYKDKLFVYALAKNRKPSLKAPLHYAPFFNVYENGNVCMGSVQIQITNSTYLENFMNLWESYFFDSYFSHQLGSYPIIKGKTDLKNLWQELSKTQKSFPTELLQPNNQLLENVL